MGDSLVPDRKELGQPCQNVFLWPSLSVTGRCFRGGSPDGDPGIGCIFPKIPLAKFFSSLPMKAIGPPLSKVLKLEGSFGESLLLLHIKYGVSLKIWDKWKSKLTRPISSSMPLTTLNWLSTMEFSEGTKYKRHFGKRGHFI